jgi:hypothetical protein
MKWRSKIKIIVHIADAPCHGTKYHSLNGDRFKEGDKLGRNIEI